MGACLPMNVDGKRRGSFDNDAAKHRAQTREKDQRQQKAFHCRVSFGMRCCKIADCRLKAAACDLRASCGRFAPRSRTASRYRRSLAASKPPNAINKHPAQIQSTNGLICTRKVHAVGLLSAASPSAT